MLEVPAIAAAREEGEKFMVGGEVVVCCLRMTGLCLLVFC